MFENSSWYDKLPDESIEIYEPHLRLFFETMYERQLVWKRRFLDKKPRPWTNDEIFQNYKFTNVYRELDRSSQWQIKNIILDKSLSLKNLVWKSMVFRMFNSPETFEFVPTKSHARHEILGNIELVSSRRWKSGIPSYNEYDEDEFASLINSIRASGGNPFTTAYYVNSSPGRTRDGHFSHVVIPYFHKNINNIIRSVLKSSSPEELFNYLTSLPNVAKFTAHEFYQDFTYISRYTNRKFMKFDQNDFTNVGPGCSLGIRLIFPSIPSIKEQESAIYILRDISAKWLKKIGDEKGEQFPYLGWDIEDLEYFTYDLNQYEKWKRDKSARMYGGITLHQVEMWLCEFSKYWKVMNKVGRQRTKFIPISKRL